MTTGQNIGYTRVSTLDQSTERQLEGLALDRTYTDKASGKDTARPQLQAAIDHLRAGDTLHVHSMDRLARNVDDLRSIVKGLTAKGVVIRFHKEGLTFTGEDSPMANLLLTMLGAVAEFERSLIRERQREGIAIAKTKGIYKGRKKALSEAQVQELRAKAGLPSSNKAALAKEYGISRETLYQYLNRR
ncbi:recombinase family protein [uncultured Propionivibrio sp.]|uniref:recombinase family protein n=1 Tax=uncultured Propionivibrio sp. TaxID=426737 RepID=UPI0029C0BF7D|nr:recombinase family protein [uncultured Propionivibrio sp.]